MFEIDTGFDPEITTIAGPQLVVPVTNARYAINAANARWGSLYDACCTGPTRWATPPPPGPYDPARGERVIAWVRKFLDDVAPLASIDGPQRSHRDVVSYSIADGSLTVKFDDGKTGIACLRRHGRCGIPGISQPTFCHPP